MLGFSDADSMLIGGPAELFRTGGGGQKQGKGGVQVFCAAEQLSAGDALQVALSVGNIDSVQKTSLAQKRTGIRGGAAVSNQNEQIFQSVGLV